jgi:ribose transport system substrate-binding protein
MRRNGPTCTLPLAGTAAVILSLALAACGGASGSGTAKTATTPPAAGTALKSIAYGDVDEADASLAVVGSGLVSLGQSLGIKVSRYDNKLDAQTALSNAQIMVQLHPSVVIDWNGVADIGPALGRVFTSARVPCIAVNTTIPGCAFFDLNDEALGEAQGTAVASIAKSRSWTAANTTLVLVNDPAAGPAINDLVYGFYTTYAAQFPAMTQMQPGQFSATTTKVGSHNAVVVNGQGTLADSYTAVKSALQVVPAGNHVIVDTFNDDSALGAERALTQAGRSSSSAMIVGNGADAAGIQALRSDPMWVADGTVFLNDWPQLLVAMARAMLAGKTPPSLTMPPQAALTKANLDTYYSGTTPKAAPDLPAADSYLTSYVPSSS